MKGQQQIEQCARRILELQRDDGRIDWIDGGIFDPWNHTLCAMALSVAGYHQQAKLAYSSLLALQEPDGSIAGQCGASAPMDNQNRKLVPSRATSLTDTNFAAFPILGILHHFRLSSDKDWLKRQLPFVQAARNFVLSHQSPHGDIAWRRRERHEKLEEVDALRTGNCSIFKSLTAAWQIENLVGERSDKPCSGTLAIQNALISKPFRFDRTWPSKDRFAMDWYYPVLSGVVTGARAKQHLLVRYDEFVAPGLGCRCVVDEPWVTTAETCELILALLAVGEKARAQSLMRQLAPLEADEGGYWMGWQFQENIFWPEERPSWTAAAVILAMDALQQVTPAHRVLVGSL